jgi:hypothetical protein
MGTKYTGQDKRFEHEAKIRELLLKEAGPLMSKVQNEKDDAKRAKYKQRLDEVEKDLRKRFPAPKGDDSTTEANPGTVRMRFDANGNPI